MNLLEGLLVYRAIEHRNEKDSSSRGTLLIEEDLLPYSDPLAEARHDPEVARAIAS